MITTLYKVGEVHIVHRNSVIEHPLIPSFNLYEGIERLLGYKPCIEEAIELPELSLIEELKLKMTTVPKPNGVSEVHIKSIKRQRNKRLWLNNEHLEVIDLLDSIFGTVEVIVDNLERIRNVVSRALLYSEVDFRFLFQSLSENDKQALKIIGVGSPGRFSSDMGIQRMCGVFGWKLLPGVTCKEEDESKWNNEIYGYLYGHKSRDQETLTI